MKKEKQFKYRKICSVCYKKRYEEKFIKPIFRNVCFDCLEEYLLNQRQYIEDRKLNFDNELNQIKKKYPELYLKHDLENFNSKFDKMINELKTSI